MRPSDGWHTLAVVNSPLARAAAWRAAVVAATCTAAGLAWLDSGLQFGAAVHAGDLLRLAVAGAVVVVVSAAGVGVAANVIAAGASIPAVAVAVGAASVLRIVLAFVALPASARTALLVGAVVVAALIGAALALLLSRRA